MFAACGEVKRAPTETPLPTKTPTPTPLPTLTPLTDEMAIARIKEMLAKAPIYGDTLEVDISEDLRKVTISYEADYGWGGAFERQVMVIGMLAAYVFARVQPPLSGGIRITAFPRGETDVGMVLLVIRAADIEAWVRGEKTDQEFVAGWVVVTVTKE